MSKGFIELNDAGILQAIDGRLLDTSPAYAVLDGDKLLLGEAGRKNARLLPRWTNNRFWNQLSSDPIADSTNTIRHHADLAFAHLEQIWMNMKGDVDQVVLAVPGYFDRPQLGLLLGMAKESNIPVSGLVDIGLISIAQQATQSTALFLDISLHRITLTELKSAGMLRKVETHTVAETGLFTLWDRWANVVAKQFIQTSRYDPMHQADSEQKLFDLLPAWMKSFPGERARLFELELNDVKHSTPVSSEQLLTACSTIYPAIVQMIRSLVPTGTNASLFISHRFQGFPGLDDSLRLIPNVDLDYLNSMAAIEAAKAHWAKLASVDGAVSHVTTLPVSGIKPKAKVQHQSPTHLLLKHRAYAINNVLRIGSFANDILDESTENTRCTVFRHGNETIFEAHDANVVLNGRSTTSQTPLQPGDELTIDDRTAVLITVT